MDPLVVSFGILVVGIGIGGTSFRSSRPDPSPVTCHCECGGDKTSPTSLRIKDLVIVLFIGITLGLCVAWGCRSLFSLTFAPNFPAKSKGKGKGGVFGASVPLSITG